MRLVHPLLLSLILPLSAPACTSRSFPAKNTNQVLPPSDEWLPFTGMQQITVRKTIKDVDIHSKCTTTATGLPSRVAPGMFEIKTLRLDIYVQVMNPTGWQRQTVALQVRVCVL